MRDHLIAISFYSRINGKSLTRHYGKMLPNFSSIPDSVVLFPGCSGTNEIG